MKGPPFFFSCRIGSGLVFLIFPVISRVESYPKSQSFFGYNLCVKTESLYFLGYLLELITKIWRFGNFFFSKSSKFGPFFSSKILSYRLKSYFSGQNLTKFHTGKKKKNWQKFVNENKKSLKYSEIFYFSAWNIQNLPNYSTNKVVHYNILTFLFVNLVLILTLDFFLKTHFCYVISL